MMPRVAQPDTMRQPDTRRGRGQGHALERWPSAGASLPDHLHPLRGCGRGGDRPAPGGAPAKEAQMSAGLTDSDTMFSVRETPGTAWEPCSSNRRQRSRRPSRRRDSAGASPRSRSPSTAAKNRSQSGRAPRCEEIPGFYATVRQDTREVLGIVGERYRLVQNHEAFTFIDQLLGSSINFETAGSLHGGRRVWVLATLPDHVEVGGDDVRPYVLLMNSHDGSTAVVAATTPIRVVCQNTLNWGLATRGRSSRSATPKRSRSAFTRLGESSICPSTTTSSSSASATSSPPSAAANASSAQSSTSSTRVARAIR